MLYTFEVCFYLIIAVDPVHPGYKTKRHLSNQYGDEDLFD